MLGTYAKFVPAMTLMALAGCGGGDNASSQADATLPRLQLTSDAFRSGQPIPTQYTCDGLNQTPTLHWGDPPAGTKGFALVIDDPDAPFGTFRHWGVFDIPASARSIGNAQRVGTEVNNDNGTKGYTGPCPPRGMHHYQFKLFALNTERLDLPANAGVKDLETAARQHAIAEGELVGTYARK
ncbi:MAG TPA: YbhB/YbcL family Raf kinase inhibitor-like protein [Sphingomicrobium sp.]|nr:YbhB/YbcL family Raf kinase inhibitor-like protein [Sphingomicrobium sp.]